MSALAKIHIAKKELNLNDDDYRAILERVTGQTTSKGLTAAQADAVVDEFKRMGFKPKVVSSRPGFAGKKVSQAQFESARKARALWLSLWQLGVVHERAESALEAFAKRQLGCERLVWADQGLVYKMIEALKAMAERAGWSQSLVNVPDGMAVLVLRRRLVQAQCEKLGVVVPVGFYALGLDQLSEYSRDLAPAVRKLGQ